VAKLKMPADAAKALTVPERLLLLCVASGIDFKHAKIAERVATEVHEDFAPPGRNPIAATSFAALCTQPAVAARLISRATVG
jgi:hypothetical protein